MRACLVGRVISKYSNATVASLREMTWQPRNDNTCNPTHVSRLARRNLKVNYPAARPLSSRRPQRHGLPRRVLTLREEAREEVVLEGGAEGFLVVTE